MSAVSFNMHSKARKEIILIPPCKAMSISYDVMAIEANVISFKIVIASFLL